ncbi:MAG TPA: glycosyltransferase [Segetibacter sp.]
MRIAALLATFNRKQKTLECLRRLQQQQLPADCELEVYLTDDASSDGTATAVKDLFPRVNLFKGTGSLFWAGGMRFTWRKALTSNPDYYLLLNDDTLLNDNAIAVLLNHTSFTTKPSIVIGSTVDLSTGKTSYGGSKLTSKSLWKGSMIEAPTVFTHVDFANANIMLVPKQIVEKIGILSEAFTHSLADYDYTLRAKKAGFDVIVAPGFLGSCVDDHGNNWKSKNTTLRERIQYLKSPKGLAYDEFLKFIKDHFPMSYPAAFTKLWLKTFFPFIWDTFKK